MKRLNWKDIPLSVLESVYKKWVKVRTDLPNTSCEYWFGCTLCAYCSIRSYHRCDVCPAVPKKWCVSGQGNFSRLYRSYHYRPLATQKWQKEITKFLKFLRRHIKNRKRYVGVG